MRRIALVALAAGFALWSATASAADMARPVYKAAAPAPAAFNWSGLYVGGNAGWGWDKGNGTEIVVISPAPPAIPIGTTRSNNRDGFLGGAQIGFNWQAPGSPWVFGVDADWSWTDASTSSAVAAPVSSTPHSRTRTGTRPSPGASATRWTPGCGTSK